jgi:hypothetical protein
LPELFFLKPERTAQLLFNPNNQRPYKPLFIIYLSRN